MNMRFEAFSDDVRPIPFDSRMELVGWERSPLDFGLNGEFMGG